MARDLGYRLAWHMVVMTLGSVLEYLGVADGYGRLTSMDRSNSDLRQVYHSFC